MEMDRIIFPITTLGPGNRVSIWTIGCPRRCIGCSNPELQMKDPRKNVSIDRIISYLKGIKDKIEGVTITGGDPFFQLEELADLVNRISKEITEDVIIYTGYKLEELYELNKPEVYKVLDSIAVLIDGEYIEKLNDNLGIRGSSNQKIYLLKDKFKDRYKDAESCTRTVKNVFYQNNVIRVGIPLKLT